jgi:hypothetical protein
MPALYNRSQLSLILLAVLCFPVVHVLAGRASSGPETTSADRSHWAFRPPELPAVPSVREASWVRTPVDAFILARLEKEGLRPASPADRATLLRRVTLDLTGLPPTPLELEAFLSDPRPDAYERVVERLLVSVHYGEEWGRHWLDLVRYAESNGYELDAERPNAWRYRDYVIRAFNEDKPYDRFVVEQLAGDLLARGEEPREVPDLLVATGFNRCGPIHLVSGNTDPAINRQEVLTEMTGAVGSTFMGLTIGCARCHDHKFDPISQGDYYRLQAFFASAEPKEVDLADPNESAAREQRLKEVNARLGPLRKQVAEIDAPYRRRLTEAKRAKLEPKYVAALSVEAKQRTPAQVKLAADAATLLKVSWDEILEALTPADRDRRDALRSKIHALEAQLPPAPARAWSIADRAKETPTHVLKRGDPKQPGAIVEPALLRILNPGTSETGTTARGDAGSARRNRLDLAHGLIRPDHPLTARVLVNRLWQHHFGRGLVATPNDWGLRGEPPTHPELLDWLACEFVRRGWSIKEMHRLMVLSSTYEQTSQVAPDGLARRRDPENRLFARMNRRRLEAEALRDNVLAVAGAINSKLGGPMIRTPLEQEVYDLIFTEGEPDGLWPVTPDTREHTRRSIYLFNKRNVRLPLFEAFDQPDTLTSCPMRAVSTFAPQALILLNGAFIHAQSRAFAAQLLQESRTDCGRQVEQAYLRALCRRPRPGEVEAARTFLASQSELLRDRLRSREPVALPTEVPEGIDPADAAALVDFCLALFNRNEFLYVR